MTEEEGSKKMKLPNFDIDEDIALCEAYIVISEDPIIGNSQHQSSFWERIRVVFYEKCKSERNANSLKCRWNHIRPRCKRFGELLHEASKASKSGSSEQDKVRLAKRMYHSKSGVFRLDHCWQIVKETMKFQVSQDTHPSNRGSPTIDVNLEDDDIMESVQETQNYRPRPLGRKAAKKVKRKGKEQIDNSSQYVDVVNSYKMLLDKKEEHKIMMVKTNDMTPERAAYWKHEQDQVLKKFRISREIEFNEDDDVYVPAFLPTSPDE